VTGFGHPAPAQDRAEAGHSRGRHRHAGGPRAGDQRDGTDAVHGGLVGVPPTGQLTGSPVGYLTYPIWTFYNLPSKTAQDLSYDAAFLLIVFLLLLIILGRLITWFARRHSESM